MEKNRNPGQPTPPGIAKGMYGTMTANDAFTAGVRPGGLTSSTEIRLLLCYLV